MTTTQVSAISLMPVASSGRTRSAAARAWTMPRPVQTKNGTLTRRPPTSRSSWANSSSEKCGLPSATASIRSPLAVDRRSRAWRSMSGVSLIVRSGGTLPQAVATSGASGVTPATWNRPTAPEDAAAAPNAFNWSSPTFRGNPAMTPTALPIVAPYQAPSTG